jgi:parvulin-like peptidyl-prolyl isomerase
MSKRMLSALLVCSVLAPLAARADDSAFTVKAVAKVGSEIITNLDVDDAVKVVELNMSPDERNSDEGKKKLEEARKRVLDRMIDEKLVVLAAKDGPDGFKEAQDGGKAVTNPYLPAGTDIEDEMEKLFDETRKRFPSQEDFEAALKAEKETIPEFRNHLRDRLRDQLTFSRMLKVKERDFQPSLHVSDEEVEKYYEDHKDQFAQGPQVDLRHILFKNDQEALARGVLEKLKKAKDIKAAFIDAAKANSQDEPTRDLGGRLGWIEKGQSWPELEAAAFAAKDNEVAGPVHTDAGWHLLLVEGHKDGAQRSLDDVKASAKNMVYQEKKDKRIQEWIEDLKHKYYVERSDS